MNPNDKLGIARYPRAILANILLASYVLLLFCIYFVFAFVSRKI